MGLYPSQTALVIRCCVHEREQTTDLLDNESEDERKYVVLPSLLPNLPRSLSTRTTLPIQ